MTDFAECKLNFDVTNEIDRAFMEKLVTLKLKLPDINWIWINGMLDGDDLLKDFLDIWTPSKIIELLMYFTGMNENLEMDFYSKSIAKTINSVSERIYLCSYGIKEWGFEQIVKSSSNSEEIWFWECTINWSENLNFNITDKCKTTLIWFYEWKFTSESDRKSDLISTPSGLENIVKAIGKCSLKTSLKKLYIYWKSVNKDEVQLLFNKYDMDHVTVVQDYIKPH